MELKCKNCQTPLTETQDYCSSCGAKVIRKRLTIKNILNDFSEQFLNYDNKFLQTFRDLFRKPEQVIDGYIQGVRKRYMNVLGYFAITLTYLGFFTYINQKFFPESYRILLEGLNSDPNAIQASTDLYSFTIEFQGFITILLIPLLALLSRIVFLKNKKYNYAEHVVVVLYGYSQITLITTTLFFFIQLDQKLFTAFSFVTLPIQIGYFIYLLKRLFGISWLKMIGKTLLFLLLLMTMYIIFIMIFSLYLLFFTDFFQKAIEAEKAKRGVSYIISSAMNWTS